MKKSNLYFCSLFLSAFLLYSCKSGQPATFKENVTANTFHQAVERLTETIGHDIFPPPISSRIYAYSTIAAYEAMVPAGSGLESLSGKISSLKAIEFPKDAGTISFPLASVMALTETGKSLIFTENILTEFQDSLYKALKANGLSDQVFNDTKKWADKVTAHIKGWYAGDNYKATRTAERYKPVLQEGFWQPTPPEYKEALEPHWAEIRPFHIQTGSDCLPEGPVKIDYTKGSEFYKINAEVHEAGVQLTEEQKELARFWDNNPFSIDTRGHIMLSRKKVSPGGHWINIAKIAALQTNADFNKSLKVYASVAMALFDGFISCWGEKYRSNYIRPETFINSHIDPTWRPYIETPPFPEYTSGHSVISAAAATVLTYYYGDQYSFTDDTEVSLGVFKSRRFKNFYEASDEAGMSRFYGGIHYKKSITDGKTQGKCIGTIVLDKLKLSKE